MMLTIAIIALVTFIAGIIHDCTIGKDLELPRPRLGIVSIMVIAWWTISMPFAIILLVAGSIWFLIFLISLYI